MIDETSVQDYLTKFGLDEGAARSYIALVTTGPMSALQVSRKVEEPRTQVYRYLNALAAIGLVSSEKLNYGTLYRHLPLENVEGLLAARDAETAQLRQSLDGVVGSLRQLAGSAKSEDATIRHFYGLAGMKQVNWNLTKAEKEYFVFELAHLTSHFDETFGKRHRERCIERGLISHDLTNDQKVLIEEIAPFNPDKSFYRYIDPKILTINFEMYIYDNVVTLLDYDAERMQAIEIHHPVLSAMMRQIYMAIWGLAKPITPQ